MFSVSPCYLTAVFRIIAFLHKITGTRLSAVYVSGSYLHTYIAAMKGSKLIPEDRDELALMVRCFLMQKVISELGHELSQQNSVDISLRGIEMLLRECRSG